MKAVLTCFILLGLCFSPHVAASNETLTVAGADWPGFVNPDGTGTYLEPIKNAFEEVADIKWDITQFERARRLFLSGRADILIGVYRNAYPDKLYPSKPLDVENELRAYFLPARVSIKEVADLDGKAIGWHRGYEFESLLHIYSSHLDYDSNVRGFALLMSGKLEVILDYEHNVPAELNKKVSSIIVLPKETLWVVFHNTPKGQMLLRRSNEFNK